MQARGMIFSSSSNSSSSSIFWRGAASALAKPWPTDAAQGAVISPIRNLTAAPGRCKQRPFQAHSSIRWKSDTESRTSSRTRTIWMRRSAAL
jgi:hypothetical protein